MQDLGAFKKDISDTISKYPKLNLLFENGFPYLKGSIDIFDNLGESIVSFAVLIKISKQHPFSFPKVWEIGGLFPKDKEFHYLDDGALCLDVRQNMVLKSKRGVKVLDFIDTLLIYNLAWRYCVLKDIPFDKKDYEHGLEGVIQEYKSMLKTDSDTVLIACLCAKVLNKLPNRNDLCFCGENKKFKKCHEHLIQNISQIPINLLKSDTFEIYEYLKAESRI